MRARPTVDFLARLGGSTKNDHGLELYEQSYGRQREKPFEALAQP